MSKRLKLTQDNFSALVDKAFEVILMGGVIAYPTESLYGLGALVSRPEAIERIRKIKGKKEPILILVKGVEMAERYVHIDQQAKRLIDHFWPGPLTIVLPAKMGMAEAVRSGSAGIGIRWSSDPFAQALVERAFEPITSTSANRSGKPPLTDAEEIEKELGDEVDLIIDAGKKQGPASTVLDLTGAEPKLIREGVIKFDDLKRFF